MLNRYPSLLLLVPFLSGLLAGPVAFFFWALLAALRASPVSLQEPERNSKWLIFILMAAAGAVHAPPWPSSPDLRIDAPLLIEGTITEGPWLHVGFVPSTVIDLAPQDGVTDRTIRITSESRGPGAWITGDRIRVVGRPRFMKGRLFLHTESDLIHKLDPDPRYVLHRMIYTFRRRLWEGLRETLSRRVEALPSAMLLGLSGTVYSADKATFRETGTAHLLAISGLHLGLIAALFVFAFRKLGLEEKSRFFTLAAALFGFCLVSGFRTPVFRAYLVCLLHLYAARIHRNVDSFAPLFNASLILILVDPACLFQISFQLSFAGYGAILIFFHLFANGSGKGIFSRGKRLQEEWSGMGFFWSLLRKTLLLLGISTASWIGTLPLVLHYFHNFNPWAPVINVLVFPFFVTALVLTALHVAAIALGLHHSLITSWPVEKSHQLLLDVLETSNTLFPHPAGPFELSWPWVVLLYGLLILTVRTVLARLERENR